MNEAQRCKAIKAYISKGDHAKEKAEQYYISAGQHLHALRETCSSKKSWEEVLRKRCDLSTGRASELMQIADGRKTQAEIREADKERKRITRQRSGHPEQQDEENQEVSEDFMEPCPDCDTPQDFWRRALMNAAGDALAVTATQTWQRNYGDWRGFEGTSELVTLAEQASEAWSEAAKILRRMTHAQAAQSETEEDPSYLLQ